MLFNISKFYPALYKAVFKLSRGGGVSFVTYFDTNHQIFASFTKTICLVFNCLNNDNKIIFLSCTEEYFILLILAKIFILHFIRPVLSVYVHHT